MHTYLFSVPVFSSYDRQSLLEFELESNSYPCKEYVCNYLYGRLSNSSVQEYNRIMSGIDVIRNYYPRNMDSKIILHAQNVWVEGQGNSVMSIRRI